MVDEYLTDTTVTYRVKELESSNRLEIHNSKDIQQFLEPIVDGFVQQRERAEYYLDEVLPVLEDGGLDSKQEVIEAMEIVDGLEEHPIQPRKSSKYDADYFRDEWDLR